MAFSQDEEKKAGTDKKNVKQVNYSAAEWINVLCHHIEIDTLQNSKNCRQLRLWAERHVIDVWEDSFGKKEGTITTWTEELSSFDDSFRTFHEHRNLDSIQVTKLFSLIDSTQITSIPDQDSIKGWADGLDGISYSIETVDNNVYRFKSYWTPEIQTDLSEAIRVQKFVDRSLDIVKANDIWKDFAPRIPFECYRIPGIIVACRGMTKKERKKRDRKKRRK